MTIVLLAVSSLVVGFSWGFLFTFKFMVMPARQKVKEVMEMSLEHIERQVKMLENLLGVLPKVREDGSMISPIQINKDN